MSMVMFVATYDSRHYSFTAAGRTEDEARRNMRRLAQMHSDKAGVPIEGWYDNDPNVIRLTPEVGYVDYTPFDLATGKVVLPEEG